MCQSYLLQIIKPINTFINILCLSVWVFVCFQWTSKRLNRLSSNFLCVTSRDPRVGSWMLSIRKKLSPKFGKSMTKIVNYYCFIEEKKLKDWAIIKSQNRRWSQSALIEIQNYIKNIHSSLMLWIRCEFFLTFFFRSFYVVFKMMLVRAMTGR